MEDKIDKFSVIGFVFASLGFLFGIALGCIVYDLPERSGQYLNYKNELYKKVSEEELENIIVLEMK